MIDLRRLAADDDYLAGVLRKGADAALVSRVVDLERRRRIALTEVESLRAEANAASKSIGQAAPDERPTQIEAAGRLKARLSDREAELAGVTTEVDELALTLPNPAGPGVPDGGEDDFRIERVVGDPVPPPPHDHADYGARMGWVDTEAGAANSGSRFAYLTGHAVLLELALVQWVMGKLVANGFTPVIPPVLVREEMMVEAGFFPTDRHQVYELPADDLYLIGTAEVALAGLHRGERFEPDRLPVRYAGFSTCFRREAGTYGKDTRGMFRVHQFDKVEMFTFASPDRSWDELEVLRDLQEEIIGELGLPYRVITVAAGDLGAPAAKKYDCEVWLPSEGRYRELTSCSNYLDYSARRLRTRVKTDTGNELVHTLNGTACAVGRTLLFLFEHGQQPDGSFVVPEVLRTYCGFDHVPARSTPVS